MASTGGEGKSDALHFGDGSILRVDALVISVGIRPRAELAKRVGLKVGLRGGTVVKDQMQTSDPRILVIGGCARHGGMIYGLVAPNYDMVEVASQLLQGARAFTGFDMSSKLKPTGEDVARFGDPFITEPHSRSTVFEDAHRGTYKRTNLGPESAYPGACCRQRRR